MVNNTVLQIPINKNLRDKAALKVEAMGFSSLQEAVRLFLNKIVINEVNITFENIVQLSPRAIKRYNKIIDEIESGKADLKSFNDTKSMMKYLNEH